MFLISTWEPWALKAAPALQVPQAYKGSQAHKARRGPTGPAQSNRVRRAQPAILARPGRKVPRALLSSKFRQHNRYFQECVQPPDPRESPRQFGCEMEARASGTLA